MAERIEFLEPVRVTKLCDKCRGEMRQTGKVFMTHPPQYPHVCIKCNNQVTYKKSYPAIEYRTKGGAI